MSSDVNAPQRAESRRPRIARRVVLGALICAAMGGVLGWMSVEPTYRATGVIRFVWDNPSYPGVEFASRAEAAGGCVLYTWVGPPIPNFDAPLEAAAVLMRSPRVLRAVAASPSFGALGVSLKALEAGLHVQRVKRTPLITVSFDSLDPDVAAGVTGAVIEANRLADVERSRSEVDGLRAALQEELEKATRAAEAAPDDEGLTDRLALLRTRSAQLDKEGRRPVRRMVVVAPTVPVSPTTDRRAPFAAIGALVGVLLAVAAGTVVDRRSAT